jgi:ribosomal protein L37AE/L43A
MNGATALHTRAPCDECGEMPATREGEGGIIICDRCGAASPHVNDSVAHAPDPLGALLGGMLACRPMCLRCKTKPALLRLASGVFCSECSSFAAVPFGENVTVAGFPSSPSAPAAVTINSRDGFDSEIEAAISALEIGWGRRAEADAPVYLGADRASGPDISAKYDATSASFAAIDSAPNDISKSSTASI